MVNYALYDDDVIVNMKGAGGSGGSGGKTSGGNLKGARGGSKQTNKRQARRNKHTTCYSAKHVRTQAAKALVFT